MNTKDILLTAVTKTKYARKEYFISEQAKSGYSLPTFLNMLIDYADGYIRRIESVINERNAPAVAAGYGNIYSLSGYSIPERVTVENDKNKSEEFIVPVDTQLLHELLSDIKEIATGKTIKPVKAKKPVAEVIATFCYILKDTELIIQELDEDAESYCKRVGKRFVIEINQNVRKYLYNNPSKGNMEKVIEFIVPNIEDKKIKDKITTYISRKLSA
jgi:hypothetical protein